MHLIKNCPSCGKKLRFPLEKGKIRVSCTCGFSFIADPDDPALFKNSSFDLSDGKAKPGGQGFIDRVLGALESIEPRKIKANVIRALYDFKYRIQNFRLLPTREKLKVLAVIAAVIAAALLIAFAVNYFQKPELGDGNIV